MNYLNKWARTSRVSIKEVGATESHECYRNSQIELSWKSSTTQPEFDSRITRNLPLCWRNEDNLQSCTESFEGGEVHTIVGLQDGWE